MKRLSEALQNFSMEHSVECKPPIYYESNFYTLWYVPTQICISQYTYMRANMQVLISNMAISQITHRFIMHACKKIPIT